MIRMWADANVMTSLPTIGGVLCSTPTTQVPSGNAANIGEPKTLTQSEFCTIQNSVRGQEPRKCRPIYSVPAQGTAKHRAKFG